MAESNRYVNGIRKRTLPTHSAKGRKLRVKAQVVYDANVRDHAGKLHTKTFANLRDAKAWVSKTRSTRDEGGVISHTRRKNTLNDYWAVHWPKRQLGSRKKLPTPLSIRTIELYEYLYERHLRQQFGSRNLSTILEDDVRAWLAGMAGIPIEGAKAFRLLSSILTAAVNDNRLTKNPCTLVIGGGSENSPERAIPESEEVHALVEALPDHLQLLALIAGFVGLRFGELRALRRRHYDPLNKRLHVLQAVTTNKAGQLIIKETKSGQTRWIPVMDDLAEVIDQHLANFVGDDPDAFLFVGVKGGQLSGTMWNKAWTEAREAVGLQDVHLHDLRHHAGTMNATFGASLKENQARLGHSTPEAAMRYQHNSERRQQELSSRLNDAFRASRQNPKRNNLTTLKPASGEGRK